MSGKRGAVYGALIENSDLKYDMLLFKQTRTVEYYYEIGEKNVN